MLEPSGLYYPNRIARAFFVAMDDVMGKHGLSSLLQLSGLEAYENALPPDNLERQFDFANLSALSEGLESMYGQRGGRGMALRVGRAAFAQGMKNFGILRGIGDPVFKALPLDQRVEFGLKALAKALSDFTDQGASVTIEPNYLVFKSETCPFAWGRNSDKPVCHAMAGILNECLSWASNGYEFYVREVACRACGADECVFRVTKTAIGDGNR